VAVAFGRAYSAIADGQEAEAVAAIDAVMEKIDHAMKASMVLLAPTDRIVASEET
jgi:alpha-D-ribose 1-methylphosphonate 5-triphosphate synthase subunit PhnG